MRRSLIAGLVGLAVIVIAAGGYYAWRTYRPAPPQTAVAPPKPAAPQPAAPSFDVVRVSPGGESVMAGRADPGSTVTVFDGDRPIGTVTADPRGEWVLVPTTPLPPGNHELGLAAKSADGAERKSQGVVVVVVPEPDKNVAGQPSSPLSVLLPRQGEGPARALQMPGGPPSAEHRILFLDIIQYDGAGNLSVSGRAPAGGHVLLYLENKPVADMRADPKGDWTARPKDAVPVGHYALRADLVDKDAKVTARVVLQFRRVEVPEALSGNQFLVVQPGNSLWRISRHAYGEGVMFTEIYEANRSEIADPNLIFPGQVVTLPPG